MADIKNTFTANSLKNISQCHSSYGKNNQLAKPQLERWKDLNNAIIDWLNNDAPDETSVKISEQNNFQFYDEIQKQILKDMFKKFRSIHPKNGSEVNHNFPTKEVTKIINDEEYSIATYFTYEFIYEGISEFIKLKTASSFEAEILDQAIISINKNDNENFYTASIQNEEIMEIDLIENPEDIIEQNFQILENFINNRQKRKQGELCSRGCDMASRCGQFPLINYKKLTNQIREIKLSKTNLIKLKKCERRAAWNLQYGIPKDFNSEYETESLGTKFHKYSQDMLITNQAIAEEENFERFKNLTSSEEEITQEILFKKYKELVEKLKQYNSLSISKSEYNLGFTVVADGKGIKKGKIENQKVATVFMGRADLVGTLGTNLPIVIELKTRPEIPEDSLEAQLYALGVSKIYKNAKKITILHIYLSEESKLQQRSTKERIYTENELIDIERKFESIAKTTSSWVPNDALSVPFTINEDCTYCEFRKLCSENRDVNKTKIEIKTKTVNESVKQKSVIEEKLKQEKEKLLIEIEKSKEEVANLAEKKLNLQQEQVNLKSQYNELKNKIDSSQDVFQKNNIDNQKHLNEILSRITRSTEELENLEKQKHYYQESNRNNDLNSIPIVAFETFSNDILKSTLREIFTFAGYGNDDKLFLLLKEIHKNEKNKYKISKSKQPSEDIRHLLTILLNIKQFKSAVKNFIHIENHTSINGILKVLKKKLQAESHHDKVNFNKDDHDVIIKFGQNVEEFIFSLLKTKHYDNNLNVKQVLSKNLESTKKIIEKLETAQSM